MRFNRSGIYGNARTFARPKKLINHVNFTKLYIKPDFPSLADDIAEPRPDVNNKVAAFIVSEKSINIFCYVKLR